MNGICIGFVSLLSFFYGDLPPDDQARTKMVDDLTFVKNIFEIKYAPAEWKKEYANWNLEREYELTKKSILSASNMDTLKYLGILRHFLDSAVDYHVGFIRYSTELAQLPFSIKAVDKRYFFSYIDAEWAKEVGFPFASGDEILMFDGKYIDDVVQDLQDHLHKHANNAATDREEAIIYLTKRAAAVGLEVPQGEIKLVIHPQGADDYDLSECTLEWAYCPELVTNHFSQTPQLSQNAFPHLKKYMVNPIFASLSSLFKFQSQEDPNQLGSKESIIPNLGTLFWEADNERSFKAYLYTTPTNHLIGYVRIPSYDKQDNSIQDFEEIIQFLEMNSDALVIDQINNPGGEAFYLYHLASMLTPYPIQVPLHRFTLTQDEIFEAVQVLSILESEETREKMEKQLEHYLEGFPLTNDHIESIQRHCQFLIQEWNAKKFVSSPCAINGISIIQPHARVQYTKPILIITNELDYSGGDFFPAIMQDNNRATIFGSRTAGAGGTVNRFTYPNRYGIESIHYTSSIAERTNNRPIENLGVTPDIPYKITVRDLESNYVDYVKAINKAVLSLIKE